MKWLFLFLLLPSLAFARPLTTRVIVLSHPSWPSHYISGAGLTATLAGASYLHTLHNGTSFKVVDIRYRKDPAPQFDKLGFQYSRFYAIRASRLHKRMRRGVDQVYYIVSPMIDQYGTKFMGGLAGGYCKKRSLLALAVGQARDFNEKGDSRILQSQIIMAHELGHLMAMKHVDTPTIMNADALTLSIQFKLLFQWDFRNILEQRACVG